MTILLVDDERVIREGLMSVLMRAGHDVTLVDNGRLALQSFLAERPDLVLLDVMMPVMDGYETCAEMRKLDRETPIVFLSALDSEPDQIRGLEVGGDDYVSKTARRRSVRNAAGRCGRWWRRRVRTRAIRFGVAGRIRTATERVAGSGSRISGQYFGLHL